MLYPLLFETQLIPLVWGGFRLKPLKGQEKDETPVGESWEVSAFPGRESIVANGAYSGKKITELISEFGSLLLGKAVYERFGTDFPLLIKFLDTNGKLSVQVHPSDEIARERHNCQGKTEMWYVVDAEPGAFVYAGFNRDITVEEYRARVENGTICEVLAKHPICRGEAFFIPAGRVHSICGSALIVEVQQNSNITYRIYDYNRPGLDGKPRQLHTEEAISAIDFAVYKEYALNYPNVMNQSNLVCENELFTVRLLRLNRAVRRNLMHQDSFIVYVCIRGACMIGDSIRLDEGQSCLVPASCADISITPLSDVAEAELIETFVANYKFEH